jgi:hypothetical protein
MTLKMSITDTSGKAISLADVTPGDITGLATITIPAADLVNIEPQFLNFTIYRLNEDSTKTIFYADTGHGAVGNMELVGSAVPVETPPRYIEGFYKHTDYDRAPIKTFWLSEAVNIFKPNLIGIEAEQEVSLDFKFNNTKAAITIQFTNERIISNATVWEDIQTFGVFPSTETLTKTIGYPLYNRKVCWVRIKIHQDNYNGHDATFDISKRNGDEYTIKIRNKGLEYKIGEVYQIDGRLVGGEIGESPNGAWSIQIDNVNGLGEIIAYTPLAEAPVPEEDTIDYFDVQLNPKKTSIAIDTVTIRL